MRRVVYCPRFLIFLALAGIFAGGCESRKGGIDPEPPQDQGAQTVPPTGGQAVLAGGAEKGGVTVVVPPGATTAPLQVTMQRVEQVPQVTDAKRTGAIYQIGPAGTRFAIPVEVRLPYPSGYSGDASALLLYTLDAQGRPEALGQPSALPGQYVTGTTTHFSPFWASASGLDPAALILSPSEVGLRSGESTVLRGEVRNAVGRVLSVPVQFRSSDTTVAAVGGAGAVTARRVGTATITATAGSATGSATVTVTPGGVASLQVSPRTASLTSLGETVQLSVLPRDAAGNTVAGALVAWTSQNEGVAEVTASGLVTAKGTGSARVIVQSGLVADTAHITVSQVAATLRLSATSVAFDALGQTADLTVAVLDVRGNAMPTGTVTWTSRNAGVASVTGAGRVTATGNGAAWITVSAAGLTDSLNVAVDQTVASLNLTPKMAALSNVGETVAFSAAAMDRRGNPVGGASYVWSVADTSVLSLVADGANARGTAKARGATAVSVRATRGASSVEASATISIQPDFDVVPGLLTLRSGATATLEALIRASDGSTTPASGVTWTSRDPTVASVSDAGLVQGVKVGRTWVVGSSALGRDSTDVTVTPGFVASVRAEPRYVEVPAGSQEKVTATARDAAGNVVADVLRWMSLNRRVAEVDQAGMVFGVDLGMTSVVVSSTNGFTDTVRVEVSSGTPVAFSISPDPVRIRAGQSETVTVTPRDARGRATRLPDTLKIAYSVRDTSVASVTSSGVVTGRKLGQTFLVASAGSIRDSVSVTTTPGVAVTARFMSPSKDTTVTAGDTITVVLEGTDGVGNVFQNVGFVLTRADGAVIEMLGGGFRIRGAKAGAAMLTATVDTVSRSIRVTVQPGPAASVVVTQPSKDTTMTAGGAVKVLGEVRDAFGNVRSDAVTMATSDGTRIRLSGDTAYAEKVGAATVTASGAGLQGTRGFTVVHGAPVTVAFSTPATDTVELGAGDQLQTVASATDAFGNVFTDGLTYRSSNAAVATVGTTGLVSGLALGQAYIVVEANPADSFLVKVVPGALSSVSVAPSSDTATAIGDTLWFKASARDGLGNPVAGVTFAWSLTNPTVGALLETAGDSVRFVSAGNGSSGLTVQASKGGLVRADTAQILVAVQVATVTVTPATANATSFGDTARFVAVARDAKNNVIAGVPFTWTSTSPLVGTVDATGLATAVANGTTSIIAAAPNAKADTASFVVSQVAASITATPATLTLRSLGDTATAVALVRDARGNAITGASITWASTATGVATVNATGRVTAVSNGAAQVIATSGALADTVDVTVSQRAAAVVLTPATASVGAIGDTVSFTTAVTDARGQAITDAAFAWSVSNAGILALQAGAGATAKVVSAGVGSATVIVQATRGGATVADTSTVTVTAVPASLVIAPDTATLTAAGATVNLAPRVTVRDGNGNIINGATVTWSSLSNAVATVTAAGVVTAVANGTVGIVATSGAAADTATVTVAIQAARVVISPVADTLAVGATRQFTAQAFDAGGNPLAATITWSSANAGIASVNATGLASGVAAGVTRIIATAGSVADTADIGVAGASSIVSTAFPNGSAHASVRVGDTVTVAISFDMSRVSANGDLGAVEMVLHYDAASFTVTSAVSGVTGTGVPNTDVAGRVSFGNINVSPQGSSKLTLLTVKMVVNPGVAVGSVHKLALAFPNPPSNTSFTNYQTPVAVAGKVAVVN